MHAVSDMKFRRVCAGPSLDALPCYICSRGQFFFPFTFAVIGQYRSECPGARRVRLEPGAGDRPDGACTRCLRRSRTISEPPRAPRTQGAIQRFRSEPSFADGYPDHRVDWLHHRSSRRAMALHELATNASKDDAVSERIQPVEALITYQRDRLGSPRGSRGLASLTVSVRPSICWP